MESTDTLLEKMQREAPENIILHLGESRYLVSVPVVKLLAWGLVPDLLKDENSEEAKSKDCDYMLLTQIADPKARPLDPHSPQISIGGRVPSVDASDPMGGSSGPVYRDNLQISFALFPIDGVDPVVDTATIAQPSGNASDNLLSAMDRESNRVSRELKEK